MNVNRVKDSPFVPCERELFLGQKKQVEKAVSLSRVSGSYSKSVLDSNHTH